VNPRLRHGLLGVVLAAAVALVAFGDRTPDNGIAEAVERAPRAARATATAAPVQAEQGREILALIPREILIGDGADRFGARGGAAPFASRDWNPPPPPAPTPPAPPPPAAPPLPFTFIGKSVGAGIWEVYLARGERSYVVRDKTVIDGMWRVDAIAPPVLTLTYLPLNQVQQLNIGVFD
jgi:hypothetical protein